MPSARERRTLRRSWDFVVTKIPSDDVAAHFAAHGRITRLRPSDAHAGACRTVFQKEGDARKRGFEPINPNRTAASAAERAEGGSFAVEDAADLLEARRD